ncbi:hypothetical protein MMC14_004446 [Varicellaria rhodocarpa]|nr:hypothetical protein [Varicellaria rhodocarpa]
MNAPTQNSPGRILATTTTTPSTPSPSPTTATATSSQPPSRWFLTVKVRILRFLARIGFYFHTLPKPSPPPPSFLRSFTTAALNDTNPATLELAFYVPADYHSEIKSGRRYPVLVNYHGGGFTIGQPTDDARWAAMVVNNLSTVVVVSVKYRLAPEYPFPTAVEDGVCALLHLADHAETLGIDARKISLSGFSAGGNLAFAVPLRLQAYLHANFSSKTPKEEEEEGEEEEEDALLHPSAPILRIISIIAWYPNLDNRLTRAHRRATSLKPSKTLPPILTSLFDASYFPPSPPASTASVASPYASPAAATDEALLMALPEHIAMYLCEWDMLLHEGQVFAERLAKLGKRVNCEVIAEREHGFDKRPWVFGMDERVGVYYGRACVWFRGVLEMVGV